jgi:hypothetical protein
MRDGRHAEWTKLRTVAGTFWLLAAAIALTVAVSAAAAAATWCPATGLPVDTAKPQPSPGFSSARRSSAVQHRDDPHHPSRDAAPVDRAGRQATVLTGLVLAAGAIAVAGSVLAGRLILPGHGLHRRPRPSAAVAWATGRCCARRRLGPLPRPDRTAGRAPAPPPSSGTPRRPPAPFSKPPLPPPIIAAAVLASNPPWQHQISGTRR